MHRFQQIGELNVIDEFDQLIGMLGQRPILCTTERRRLCRQRQRGLLQGAADVLHKGGPSLLVFLIQALGLLELLLTSTSRS